MEGLKIHMWLGRLRLPTPIKSVWTVKVWTDFNFYVTDDHYIYEPSPKGPLCEETGSMG